jgi:hypothetical protein
MPVRNPPAAASDAPSTFSIADDMRGVAQLLRHGAGLAADVAEGVHAGILGTPALLLGGSTPAAGTRGITRVAYQGVRGTAHVVAAGVDALLSALQGPLGVAVGGARREALLAALNGVLGDHLAASGNPLALQACLRVRGKLLALEGPRWPAHLCAPTPRLLVQVHGLCMNHLQWRRDGHDHGERLATLGYTPVHFHYNTGLPIAENGRRLSLLLQQLLAAWPMPVERFAFLGHSMGGLVARAAIAAARRDGSDWAERLTHLVFLGTPLHGAPLERAGHGLQAALGLSPWTAPFVRLGGMRSAGIQDLRHGAADGLVLPAGLRVHAVAGTLQDVRAARPGGDGLVPVHSALGEHRDPGQSLDIPQGRRLLVARTGHLALLGSARVSSTLQRWLA